MNVVRYEPRLRGRYGRHRVDPASAVTDDERRIKRRGDLAVRRGAAVPIRSLIACGTRALIDAVSPGRHRGHRSRGRGAARERPERTVDFGSRVGRFSYPAPVMERGQFGCQVAVVVEQGGGGPGEARCASPGGSGVLRARTPKASTRRSRPCSWDPNCCGPPSKTRPAPGRAPIPDRAGFSIARRAARDRIILATGVITDTVIDLVGTVGRHVLAALLTQDVTQQHTSRPCCRSGHAPEIPGRIPRVPSAGLRRPTRHVDCPQPARNCLGTSGAGH
ncbi:hypothetical protein GCM10010254_64720 [Streptomyces chromofuscus]|nr:hypothetical protein GCM10010254_64720 [Streptomyces chromofuscus]